MGSDEGEGTDTQDHDEGPKGILETFERELSVRWLGVLGVIAILFAVVYSVVYAVQEGIIGPAAQILLGVSAGVVMSIGGGYVAKRTRHEQWGWIVSGGGVAVTYFVLYASYGFETYREAIGVPFWLVLVALSVVVVTTAVVSAVEDKRFLAGEAFLLGYVAAYLARGELGLVSLGYAFLLTVGILIFVLQRQWIELELGGVVGAYAVYVAWEPASAPLFAGSRTRLMEAGIDEPSGVLLTGSAYLLLTFLVYMIVSVFDVPEEEPIVATEGGDGVERYIIAHSIAVVNAAAFLLFSLRLVGGWGEGLRFAPFLIVGLVLTGVSVVTVPDRRPFSVDRFGAFLDRWEVRRIVAAPYLSSLCLFIAAVYGDVFWSSFIGVLIVLTFLLMSVRLETYHFEWSAHLLMAVVASKILVYDWSEFGSTATSEPAYEAATVSVAFLGIVSYLVYSAVRRDIIEEVRLVADESAGIGVRKSVSYSLLGTSSVLIALYIEFTGYALSGFWAVFALVLLVFGLYSMVKEIRMQALGILAMTVIKILVIDMRGEEIITRVISLGVLGIVLIIAAFGYSKYLREEVDIGATTEAITEVSVGGVAQTSTGDTEGSSYGVGGGRQAGDDEAEKRGEEDLFDEIESDENFETKDGTEQEPTGKESETLEDSVPDSKEKTDDEDGDATRTDTSESEEVTEPEETEEKTQSTAEGGTEDKTEHGSGAQEKEDEEKDTDSGKQRRPEPSRDRDEQNVSSRENVSDTPGVGGTGAGKEEKREDASQRIETERKEMGEGTDTDTKEDSKETIFCPDCGTEAKKQDNFCISCGYELRNR